MSFAKFDYNGRNETISVVCAYCLSATIVLDLISPFLMILTGTGVVQIGSTALSWAVFGLLSLLVLHAPPSRVAMLLKAFIILCIIKWSFYIVLKNDFALRKDILSLFLFSFALHVNKSFQKECVSLIERYKYWVLLIALCTYIPFMGQHEYLNPDSSGDNGMYRTNGLWANSKQIAMYFIALMMILPKSRISLICFLAFLVLYCGARSVTLAALPYFLYVIHLQWKSNKSSSSKYRVILYFGISSIMLFIFAFFGAFDYVFLSLQTNFTQLMSAQSIDDFGSARGFLNRIALDEYKQFGIIDKLIGQSYGSMEELYLRTIGHSTWPHNDYVMTLYCYGFLGVAFYVYFLLIHPWRCIRPADRLNLAAVQMTVIILGGATGFYPYIASLMIITTYGVLYEHGRDIGSNV